MQKCDVDWVGGCGCSEPTNRNTCRFVSHGTSQKRAADVENLKLSKACAEKKYTLNTKCIKCKKITRTRGHCPPPNKVTALIFTIYLASSLQTSRNTQQGFKWLFTAGVMATSLLWAPPLPSERISVQTQRKVDLWVCILCIVPLYDPTRTSSGLKLWELGKESQPPHETSRSRKRKRKRKAGSSSLQHRHARLNVLLGRRKEDGVSWWPPTVSSSLLQDNEQSEVSVGD